MSGFPGFYVTIENVAALGGIGCKVSLEKVVKAHPEHTRGFPAVAFKFRDQKLKASVLVSKTPFKLLQQNMSPAGKPLSVTFFSVSTAIILGV